MNFTLVIIFNFSIFIAAVIAWVRFGRINKVYYPILYCVWLAALNELLSFILVKNGFHTSVNNNIYVLLEALLIISFFKNLVQQPKQIYWYNAGLIAIIIIWIIENIILNKIVGISIYFRIIYSFVIVLLSISTINRLITTVRKNIFRNSIFLLCLAFTIYYTYKILVEAFWLYGLNSSDFFRLQVYRILNYINLFTNLIYALAILWMPKKVAFTLPSQ